MQKIQAKATLKCSKNISPDKKILQRSMPLNMICLSVLVRYDYGTDNYNVLCIYMFQKLHTPTQFLSSIFMLCLIFSITIPIQIISGNLTLPILSMDGSIIVIRFVRHLCVFALQGH